MFIWTAWYSMTSLNMVELASLNMVVDRLVHVCWNRLAWWMNRLEQRCWNHHDKSTAMFMHMDRPILLFYHSLITWTAMLQQPYTHTVREQPLSICKAVYNMLKHDWSNTVILPILFYHANSAVTGLLSQQPCNTHWYFYACSICLHILVYSFSFYIQCLLFICKLFKCLYYNVYITRFKNNWVYN